MIRVALAGAVLLAAATAAAAGAPAFDARRPEALAGVFKDMGAGVEQKSQPNGFPFLQVKGGDLEFSANYLRCEPASGPCMGVIYAATWGDRKVSLDQANRWNQTSPHCRGMLTGKGEPEVTFFAILPANLTREDLGVQAEAWRACLNGFNEFTKDPEAFLKAN